MVASRKYIRFLFEFAVRGHPKQDGKYEFQDWHPVMMMMLNLKIQKFMAIPSRMTSVAVVRMVPMTFKNLLTMKTSMICQVMNGQLSHFFFGKYAGSQKGLPFQVNCLLETSL